MRNAVSVILALIAAALFGAIAAGVNLTVGIWILHTLVPVFWFTRGREGVETFEWPLAANIVTWIYYVVYVLPSTVVALGIGWSWGRGKVRGAHRSTG